MSVYLTTTCMLWLVCINPFYISEHNALFWFYSIKEVSQKQQQQQQITKYHVVQKRPHAAMGATVALWLVLR